MEIGMVQILVQAGGVGIAFFALWINWKLVSNHINHNTASQEKLAVVIKELSTMIKDIKR